jgi:hypothetical protein
MTPEQLKKQLDWHAGREDSFFNHDRDMFKAIRRVVNEYLKLSATDEDEVRRRNVEGPRGMLRYPTTGATDAEKPLSDAEHATAMLLQDATAPPPGTPAEPAPLQILERAVERKTGKTIEYLRNTPLDELPASPAPQGAAPLAGLAAKVREIQNPYKNTPPFNYSFVAWQEAIEAAASLVENASANKQSTS